MKKVFLLFSFYIFVVCISSAQVRIGNLEVTMKSNDTIIQVRHITEKNTVEKKKNPNYMKTSCFTGWSFMSPQRGNDYYSIWSGNTFHFEIGSLHRYNVSRRFSIGATLQYAFFNYRFKDITKDVEFVEEVIGHEVDAEDIYKQVYRSNNIGTSAFLRYYLVPPRHRSNSSGVYLDAGIRGDFSYSKFFKTKSNLHGNHKYRDGYAFNPFNASAMARVGWKKIAIVGYYRITDVFNRDALSKKLPPLSFGIQFM